jgi:hypothetical protein
MNKAIGKYIGTNKDNGKMKYSVFTDFRVGMGWAVAKRLLKNPIISRFNTKDSRRIDLAIAIILANCWDAINLEYYQPIEIYTAYSRDNGAITPLDQVSGTLFKEMIDRFIFAGYLEHKKGIHLVNVRLMDTDALGDISYLSSYRPSPALREIIRKEGEAFTKDMELIQDAIVLKAPVRIEERLITRGERKGKSHKVKIKDRLDFIPTDFTREAEADVMALNRMLLRAEITIHFPKALTEPIPFLSDKDFKALSSKERRDRIKRFNLPTSIMLCRKSLKCKNISDKKDRRKIVWFINPIIGAYQRVFNDGRWDRGGRNYSRLCNIPRAIRAFMLIDGERAVEVDYVALHIYLLYALLGISYPIDLDPYGIYLPGLTTKESRAVAKLAILAILNALEEEGAIGAIRGEINRGNIYAGTNKAEDVLKAIKAIHPKLEEYLASGVGKRLQFIDSEIIRKVIARMIEANKVIIPLHDAGLCKESDAPFLKQVMEEEYRAYMNSEIVASIKESKYNG